MKQSTKRLFSMILALILVVAAFVIFFNFTQPTYGEVRDIQNEKLSLENFIDEQRGAINQVKKLIDAYEGNIDFQEAISASFSPEPDLAGAISQFSGLADLNDLSLLSFSVTETGARDKKPPAPRRAVSSLEKSINVLTFTLDLIGTYENLKSFLKNLETNVRIFELQDLSIQPLSKSAQNLYNVSIRIETYYQGQ